MSFLAPVIFKSALASAALSYGITLINEPVVKSIIVGEKKGDHVRFVLTCTIGGVALGIFGSVCSVTAAVGAMIGGVIGFVACREAVNVDPDTSKKIKAIISGLLIGAAIGYIIGEIDPYFAPKVHIIK